MRKATITILLALVAVTGWAQKKVWNNVVTGFVNYPFIKVTKVAIYDDHTEVFLRIEAPQNSAGKSVPLAANPLLQAEGKDYAAKGETVTKQNEPYIIPADGTLDFSLVFEPIPVNTSMISMRTGPFVVANVHEARVHSTGLTDTYWRNESTGDWLIGFTKDYVIYKNKVWDIVSQKEKKDIYTMMLDDGTSIKVDKPKKGLRQIIVGKDKAIACSQITGTTLPDYPIKDTRTGFVDNGYNPNDSVTIIGWMKDMPQEALSIGDVEVNSKELLDLFSPKEKSTYVKMDSLGRFSLKMPLLNSSQVLIDPDRSIKIALLEPGKTYFLLSDFMTGQTLWMGDDVRLQNELLAHLPVSCSERIERDQGGKANAMEFKAKTDSSLAAALAYLEETIAQHPNLSQRYIDFVKGYCLMGQGESLMQARYEMPNYELPQEYMDYVSKECWQKAPKPYTLYRDFVRFMDDYLDQIMSNRTWNVNLNIFDYNNQIASNDEELALLNQWKNWYLDGIAKVAAAPQEEKEKISEKLNADNADMIKEVNKIIYGPKGLKVQNDILFVKRMKQELFALDSLGADQIIKDIWLSKLVYGIIDNTHTSVSPLVIDTLKALVKNPLGIERIEKANAYYLAIENREFDKLVLKSSDNLAELSEGEALLKKILEPYKGKFVLLDIWGTWCGPCKEALSHSTEESARLKDYDIQYLYLANNSPQTAWENVIKEYNVSGPNVAHYNLPREQQAAIERHLNVHSWPTYKLFNRDGDIMNLNVDPRDLERLASLLESLK